MRNKIGIIFLFVSSIFMYSTVVSAQGLYAGIAYLNTSVFIAEQEYKPSVLQLSVGWQFTDKFGMRLASGQSNSSAIQTNVETDIKTLNSLLFHYGTAVNNKVNVYVLGGYSEINLLTRGSTFQKDEEYSGASWGFGFEERANKNSGVRLYFDYTMHHRQTKLNIDSYQLGLRYAFD